MISSHLPPVLYLVLISAWSTVQQATLTLPCEDKPYFYYDCTQLVGYCKVPHANRIRESCPVTCGLCEPNGDTLRRRNQDEDGPDGPSNDQGSSSFSEFQPNSITASHRAPPSPFAPFDGDPGANEIPFTPPPASLTVPHQLEGRPLDLPPDLKNKSPDFQFLNANRRFSRDQQQQPQQQQQRGPEQLGNTNRNFVSNIDRNRPPKPIVPREVFGPQPIYGHPMDNVGHSEPIRPVAVSFGHGLAPIPQAIPVASNGVVRRVPPANSLIGGNRLAQHQHADHLPKLAITAQGRSLTANLVERSADGLDPRSVDFNANVRRVERQYAGVQPTASPPYDNTGGQQPHEEIESLWRVQEYFDYGDAGVPGRGSAGYSGPTGNDINAPYGGGSVPAPVPAVVPVQPNNNYGNNNFVGNAIDNNDYGGTLPVRPETAVSYGGPAPVPAPAQPTASYGQGHLQPAGPEYNVQPGFQSYGGGTTLTSLGNNPYIIPVTVAPGGQPVDGNPASAAPYFPGYVAPLTPTDWNPTTRPYGTNVISAETGFSPAPSPRATTLERSSIPDDLEPLGPAPPPDGIDGNNGIDYSEFTVVPDSSSNFRSENSDKQFGGGPEDNNFGFPTDNNEPELPDYPDPGRDSAAKTTASFPDVTLNLLTDDPIELRTAGAFTTPALPGTTEFFGTTFITGQSDNETIDNNFIISETLEPFPTPDSLVPFPTPVPLSVNELQVGEMGGVLKGLGAPGYVPNMRLAVHRKQEELRQRSRALRYSANNNNRRKYSSPVPVSSHVTRNKVGSLERVGGKPARQLSVNANIMVEYRLSQCCKLNKISDFCQPLCSYRVSKEEIFAKAGSGHCGLRDAAIWIKCASGGVRSSQCCRAKGITTCDKFCDGEANVNELLGCATDHLPAILQCHKDNYAKIKKPNRRT